MDELKPCPFCGSKDVAMAQNPVYNIMFVHCDGCGLIASFRQSENAEDTVAAWNRRALDNGYDA